MSIHAMLSHANKRVVRSCCLILLLAIVASCRKPNEASLPIQSGLTPFEIKYPFTFPALEIPADNPLTVEGIALGKALYSDPILSNDGRACADCHQKSTSFTTYSVNALAHVNEGWNTKFLWRGNIEGTLEDAMAFEVNDFFKTDIARLNANEAYKAKFKHVYAVETISRKNVAYALAQYLRSLTSVDSRFDRYVRKESMMTMSELNGFYIFNSEKGECFHCHSLGLFADNAFHNNGIDSVFIGTNAGRYDVTHNLNDLGKFKTPTLRNIELTAPYMHDGRYQTLEEVVEHYNSGVKKTATIDPIMTLPSFENGLQLTTQQKSDLVAFLKTLTDTSFVNNPLH